MNVLFVSNSTCNYLADELYGMLSTAGCGDAVLGLVYYAGCSIAQHEQWRKEGAANYEFRLWDQTGYRAMEACSLQMALDFLPWDVITFDNNAKSFASGEVEASLAQAEPYFGSLYGAIRQQFPSARYLWHEVWSNEIGYHSAFEMKTKAQRTQVYLAKRGVMEHMQKTYGMEVVPTGDAWEKVRDLPLFTTPIAGLPIDRFTLCTRIKNGMLWDDFSHDGDMGGGQYLNACVWFEVLTERSCLGNTFRPVYVFEGMDCSLSEEKIAILQQAAHEAVAALGK